jgi:hypothetical protein
MSLSGDEFIRFLILIIPGFWGLWIYKPFVYKGDEDFIWEKDFILAAMFALPGYLLATTFFSERHLIVQIFFSTITAVLFSACAGIFIRLNPHPLYWFASKFSAEKNAEEDTPYGRALAYVREKLINKLNNRDGNTPVAIIYHLGDRENAEIGVLVYHTARFNEVVLDTRPPISLQSILENDCDITPWCKTVNLDSSVVVEIANIKTEIIDRIYADYCDAISSSA